MKFRGDRDDFAKGGGDLPTHGSSASAEYNLKDDGTFTATEERCFTGNEHKMRNVTLGGSWTKNASGSDFVLSVTHYKEVARPNVVDADDDLTGKEVRISTSSCDSVAPSPIFGTPMKMLPQE